MPVGWDGAAEQHVLPVLTCWVSSCCSLGLLDAAGAIGQASSHCCLAVSKAKQLLQGLNIAHPLQGSSLGKG